ncbi:hypothetical protein KAJ41_00925 [Candidatus Parcubacteria bacterium]|nr:hypothetical protein [Candidatus Parcubacteria bacterium]
MIEIRKDYVLDRWSYIADDRGKRPEQFKKVKESKSDSICYFCPGNESLTPPEIGRLKKGKNDWKIRWFLNKFPIVNEDSNQEIKNTGHFFESRGGFGFHEIIVETPDHRKQLADLSIAELKSILKTYSLRIAKLSEEKRIRYVQIFKNSGSEAGASLVHSHS